MGKAKKEKSILVTLIKVFLVILILLVAAIGFMVMGSPFKGKNASLGKEEQETVKRNVVVCDDSLDISGYDANEVNTSSNHDVKMNSTWTFNSGESYSRDAYVENPSTNKNSVYFDITVSGSNEKIYTSPILPVGSHIENISFDKELSAGTYNGILTYTLLGSDGETSIGTLQMALKIIVQR